MAERSVAVKFDANVSGYMAGIAKMQASTASFAKAAGASATKHKADWDKIGNTALVGGAAIGVAVLGAAKAYMEFEAAMSGVAAVADATAQQQKALGKAAIQAGQDTVFSATEAAKAEAELAKAGVSVNDILGGALTGSLNLAAAGQIDLAKAAEISAQAMNIFKLEGSDVGHIADVLTAGANKSAAGVDDLGMALQQSGLVAAQTGLSLEDTTGVLSAFADNALKGSDAGTSLKTMLQRLNPQSDEAAGLMDELGLRAYDAAGNFVGITQYAGKLQTALGGLTVEQRNAALSTLFGSDAIRGASILMEQGEAGVRKYIDAVNDQGAAQRMAARQTDNLKGDIEQLKGTLESAFINGGQGSNAGIRSLVQSLTGMVDGFNKLSPAAQTAAVQIAAVTAAALLVGGAGIKAVAGISAMSKSMQTLGASSATAGTALKALSGAVAVAGVAMLANELGKIGPAAATADVGVRGLVSSVGQLAGTGRLTGGIADLFREDNGIFGSDEKWVSSAEAVERFAIRAQNAFGQDFSSQARRLQDFGASGAKMEETVRKIDGALAELVRGGNADQAKASLEALLKGISDPAVREQTRAQFTALQAALDETGAAAVKAGDAIDPMTGAIIPAGKAAADAAKAADDYATALDNLHKEIIAMGGGLRAEQQAIADSTEAHKDALKVAKDAKATRADDEAALRSLSEKYLEVSAAQVDMGRGAGEVSATMKANRGDFIATAVAMGYNKTFAEGLADAYGLIPEDVETKVEAVGAVTSATQVKNLNTVIKGLDGKTVTVKEAGKAKPSKDNVLELDGSILGLKDKTVKVQELGSTASGDRVVKFNGKIYTLKGKTVTVSETGATPAKGRVESLQARINSLRGNTVTITTRYVTTGTRPGGGRSTAGGITKADGGAIYGPGTGTSDSIPAMLSNGEHVLTAEEVRRAGGQDAIYRMRRGINAGALKFAQGGAVGPAKFAEGGAVDWQDIMAIIGDVTVWDDVKKARTSAATAATGVKSSRATLLSMRAAVNAANRALAAARKTRGRADDSAALDKRRTALARLAAAEAKYSQAAAKSAAATRSLRAVEREYTADRRPLLDRALTASAASNTKTKAFLDNIDKLTRMGFKTLAMYLLDQGGPEAMTLAAQAVKSASKAKSLQSNLSRSSALADREAAIRAALNGTSLDGIALNGLGTYNPVRDLGPISRGAVIGGSLAPVVINVSGAIDPISVGAQIEKSLQTYTSTTGRPLQVVTK